MVQHALARRCLSMCKDLRVTDLRQRVRAASWRHRWNCTSNGGPAGSSGRAGGLINNVAPLVALGRRSRDGKCGGELQEHRPHRVGGHAVFCTQNIIIIYAFKYKCTYNDYWIYCILKAKYCRAARALDFAYYKIGREDRIVYDFTKAIYSSPVQNIIIYITHSVYIICTLYTRIATAAQWIAFAKNFVHTAKYINI
jgi:hypothetical protein